MRMTKNIPLIKIVVWAMLIPFCMISCTEERKEGKISGVNDLEERHVGYEIGSSQDFYAHKTFDKSHLVGTKSGVELLIEVRMGKVDVGLDESPTVKIYQEKYPEIGIVADSIYGGDVGFAFSEKRKDLRNKFNSFLKNLRFTGEYERICDKWLNHYETAEIPKMNSSGKHGVITFHTTGQTIPFSVVKGGELAGLDVELAERFAASLDMNLMVVAGEFAGVIASVSTGKVDMAAACIAITPERAKKFLFSDPYYHSNTCVYALKRNIKNTAYHAQDDEGYVASVKESFYQNFVEEGRYKLIFSGLLCTLEISFFSAIFGTLLGILLCYISMRKSKFARLFTEVYITFFHVIPQVVLLMILYYVVFGMSKINGETVSVICFSIVFGATVCSMLRSAIMSVSKGQTEAGLSLGFSSSKTFYYFVLPLVINRMLPSYKSGFIGLIKATSIVGYITVEDLAKMSDDIRSATFDAFMPLILVAIIYFILVWVISVLVGRVSIRFKPHRSVFLK